MPQKRISTFTSVGVRLRRSMLIGAIGAVADAAPYALIVDMFLLN